MVRDRRAQVVRVLGLNEVVNQATELQVALVSPSDALIKVGGKERLAIRGAEEVSGKVTPRAWSVRRLRSCPRPGP